MIAATEFIVAACAIVAWALVVRVMWAAREGIAWVLKAALIGALALIAAQWVLVHLGRNLSEVKLGGYVCAGLAVVLTPKRSRYVPAAVRRQVIARDLKGKAYSGRRHHIDHIWPHSRGGSNTADNLRVIPRKENLRKGGNKPGLKDWL